MPESKAAIRSSGFGSKGDENNRPKARDENFYWTQGEADGSVQYTPRPENSSLSWKVKEMRMAIRVRKVGLNEKHRKGDSLRRTGLIFNRPRA